MTPPTLAEALHRLAGRLQASWRLTRQTEEFHLEQDQIRHDLEALARKAEGAALSRETISERRI
ncbi:hypothetical protein [Taklimakanibacter deserti]|uniref:hypothetical protein n=1 Tax=Taklimakanibacter deserti TaxID=2267839 RepID=UPI000E650D7B